MKNIKDDEAKVENARQISSENITDDEKADYVVHCLGEFGYWQARVCVISTLIRLLVFWNIMSMVILFPKTRFKCMKFASENVTKDVQNSTCYNDCVEYKYENVLFDDNLTSKFGLICDRAWLTNFAQTLLMFGFLCGITLFGWISDRFGRQLTFRLGTTICVVFMIAVPFSNNYLTFVVLRYFVGFGSGGIMCIGPVLVLEIIGPKYRDIVGSFILLPDQIGPAILALAYFATSWQWFLEGFALFSILFLVLLVYIPETPRWLITNGRTDDAFKLIKSAVKYNKKEITDEYIKANLDKNFEALMENKDVKSTKDIYLFRRDIIKRISLVSVIWTMFGACYFGLSQYTSYIAGSNVYLVIIVNGFIQIPSIPISWLLNRFGRKISLFLSAGILCISMISLTFLPRDRILCTALGAIGLGAVQIAIITIMVFTSELFPTPLRSKAVGTAALGPKLAAMLVPYVSTLEPLWVPSTIFAICPVIALLIICFLPETKGNNLKDKI